MRLLGGLRGVVHTQVLGVQEITQAVSAQALECEEPKSEPQLSILIGSVIFAKSLPLSESHVHHV